MDRHVRIRIEAAAWLLGIFLAFLFAASTSSLAHGLLSPLDSAVAASMQAIHTPFLTAVFLFITYLGNWQVVLSIEAVLVCILFVTHRRSAIPISFAMLVVGQMVSWGLKLLTARTRPESFNILKTYGADSFPSGHALIGVVLYGVIAYLLLTKITKVWLRGLVWVVASILALSIGISRVYLGVHWFSDVLGGWVLGTILLIVLILFFEHADSLNANHLTEPRKRITLMFIIALLLVEGFFLYQFYKVNPLPVSSGAAMRTIERV